MSNVMVFAGSVSEEGRGRFVLLSSDTHVYLRVRLLSAEEQPVDHIRGKCSTPEGRGRLCSIFVGAQVLRINGN